MFSQIEAAQTMSNVVGVIIILSQLVLAKIDEAAYI